MPFSKVYKPYTAVELFCKFLPSSNQNATAHRSIGLVGQPKERDVGNSCACGIFDRATWIAGDVLSFLQTKEEA